MPSVLLRWVQDLPFRMQSVLTSSLRGCDTARKDDSSKFITRALRSLILYNADPSNTFIVGAGLPEDKYVESFLWDLDSYPLHFVMHTAHAAEIVGYKHPMPVISTFWLGFYRDVVKGLHVNPETEEQLDVRLGFTPHELLLRSAEEHENAPGEASKKKPAKKVDEKAHKWDAGTGTSHGGRDREWSGGS